jgi:hypothetical protein
VGGVDRDDWIESSLMLLTLSPALNLISLFVSCFHHFLPHRGVLEWGVGSWGKALLRTPLNTTTTTWSSYEKEVTVYTAPKGRLTQLLEATCCFWEQHHNITGQGILPLTVQ